MSSIALSSPLHARGLTFLQNAALSVLQTHATVAPELKSRWRLLYAHHKTCFSTLITSSTRNSTSKNHVFGRETTSAQSRTICRSICNMSAKKVCIIGSGNWGSAIAKIVGTNTACQSDTFVTDVPMWVFEEEVNGRKLTEIINTDHENVKYLPGRKLPENIIAVPDIVQAASDADILVIVIPHQFVARALSPLTGKLKPGAQGISLIKGFDILPGGGIQLISSEIKKHLDIPIAVLMGANLAGEVADGHFCETTIGCTDLDVGKCFKKLFETENFRVTVVDDVSTVEMCGALKNIVACAAGFVQGLQYGDNTKSAVIRIGLMEMIKYAKEFGDSPKLTTFFESCGVADLVTTCYGGRNARLAREFVIQKKNLAELELELLKGQKAQGPETAAEVNFMLKAKGLEQLFPLFTAVHRIFTGEMQPEQLIDMLRSHPAHSDQGSYAHL